MFYTDDSAYCGLPFLPCVDAIPSHDLHTLDTNFQAFNEGVKTKLKSAVNLCLPLDSAECDVDDLEYAGDLFDDEEGVVIVWAHDETPLGAEFYLDDKDAYGGVLRGSADIDACDGVLPVSADKDAYAGVLRASAEKDAYDGVLRVSVDKDEYDGVLPVSEDKNAYGGVLRASEDKDAYDGVLPVSAEIDAYDGVLCASAEIDGSDDKVELIELDCDRMEDVGVFQKKMSLETAIHAGVRRCRQRIVMPCSPLREKKEKKTRKNHATNKVARLKKIFKSNQLPGHSQFLEMSEKLGMTVHQLRTWFNNERKRSPGEWISPYKGGAVQGAVDS